MQQQLTEFFKMPEIQRKPDEVLVIEPERYKSYQFWMTVITKFGTECFKFVKQDKTTKFGTYYNFIAEFELDGVKHTIPVNVKAKNFVVNRVSARAAEGTDQTKYIEGSFLMYKSQQTTVRAHLVYNLLHLLSCIQYKLFCETFPSSMNQLTFSYSPISTKATNTTIVPHKEPFIKFSMSINKPKVTTTKGTFDMNTKFTRYELGNGKFDPIPVTVTADNIADQITDGSLVQQADVDLSNVHIPTSRVGYVSFKANVRSLVYCKNEFAKTTHKEINSDDDMFAEMIRITSNPQGKRILIDDCLE